MFESFLHLHPAVLHQEILHNQCIGLNILCLTSSPAICLKRDAAECKEEEHGGGREEKQYTVERNEEERCVGERSQRHVWGETRAVPFFSEVSVILLSLPNLPLSHLL